MNSQNSIGIKGIIILLLLVVGLPLGLFIGNQKAIHYQTNGMDVTATVVNVEEWKVNDKIRQKVTVTYTDKDGTLTTAEVINPGSVSANDTIVGKVLPENPQEVYMEPSLVITILVYGITVFCFLVGLLVIFGLIRGRMVNKQMAANSRITDAVIMKRVLIGDMLFVDVGFKDDKGVHRYGSCRVPDYLYSDYMNSDISTCTIRYLVKSEKKTNCEIV